MYKKIVVSVLCFLMVLNCVGFAVEAETISLTANYNEALGMIKAAEDAFLPLTTAERKTNFSVGGEYLKTDIGIDALIEIIQDESDESPSFFKELAVNKDLFIFALCIIKSLPEANRVAAVDEFLAKKQYDVQDEDQQAALTDVYEALVDEEFRNMFADEHGRNENTLLNLFSCIKGSFVLTDNATDTDKLALESIDEDGPDSFKEKLENNLSPLFSEINGTSTQNGESVIKAIIAAVNSGASDAMISDYKKVFDALGMYKEYIPEETPSKPRRSGGCGG
ncbi:MAG: hypothetical protein GX800_00200, partial [Clostridiaceae bacterium]|nr:hypothetical protein [Clostridiaceae bacterium]